MFKYKAIVTYSVRCIGTAAGLDVNHSNTRNLDTELLTPNESTGFSSYTRFRDLGIDGWMSILFCETMFQENRRGGWREGDFVDLLNEYIR